MGELVLLSLFCVFVFQTIGFLISIKARDASLVDVFWGLGFVLIAAVLLFKTEDVSLVQIGVAMLVYIWGFRLTYHIGKRKLGKPEDFRYAKWRKEWGKWFNLRSYLQVFLLQGLLMVVISAGVLVSANAGEYGNEYNWLQLVGLAVWAFGFIFEAVADYQMSQFKSKKSKNDIITTGLWRYSRHPNYFGEVTLWWGLWLMVIQLPYGAYAIISPLVITFLIVFVSGVPLLEKKYKSNKAYQDYSKKTSKLIPLPRKG